MQQPYPGLDPKTPKYLNTTIEGMFQKRLKQVQLLKETQASLAQTEHDIALSCCPYFLGQIVWRILPRTGIRLRCIVSRISFKEFPPYYRLYLSEQREDGRWSRRPHPVTEISSVTGVEDYFHEKPEVYLARLEALIAEGVVKNREFGTTIDSKHIVARCQSAKLGEEFTSLRPELKAMLEKAFKLK